jgi:hypothetical protein
MSDEWVRQAVAATAEREPVRDDFAWLSAAMSDLCPMPVEVQDAYGEWHKAVALTGIEGTHMLVDGRMRKVHGFAVIWVSIDGGRRMPWPDEYVRQATEESR